jgi:hypothetical protein
MDTMTPIERDDQEEEYRDLDAEEDEMYRRADDQRDFEKGYPHEPNYDLPSS